MRRRIRIAVLALIIWSGTIGGAAFAEQSPVAVEAPSAEQRLAPQVARLARELGVTLDSRAAIEPRGAAAAGAGVL